MDLNNQLKECEESPLKYHLSLKEELIDQAYVLASNDADKVDPLKIYFNKYLGGGSFNSLYVGKFNKKLVAVKQMRLIPIEREIIQQKMQIYMRLEHENVVKLWDVSFSHDRYTRLILDLCTADMEDFCEQKYIGPMPPDDKVFLQTVSGVEYIHSQNLLHRDIKPTNVLVSSSSPVHIKVSEVTWQPKKISDIFNQSECKPLPYWMATESLEQLQLGCEPDETIATDIFSTGCVLFYFLTRGTHPFGNSPIWLSVNIVEHNPVELIKLNKNNLNDCDRILYGLIEEMIGREENRIGLSEVKKQLTDMLSAKLTCDSSEPDKITEVENVVGQQDLK
uniref:Protein kinase domain-containing protein n=1 Tax=Daphnia galeata TaxID=27404 RepID=A0A8J2RAF6_9CRUS|nr:unnamed protein product [Daphnia galeata]